MPIAPPPEALGTTPIGDLEAQIAQLVDLVTKTAQAIDHNPLLKWAIPASQRKVLDEIVSVLEAVNGFLHKTP